MNSLRLALRVSNLPSRDVEEKRHLFELIKKAYDLRSDIVHGSKYNSSVRLDEGESLSIGEFVFRVEDCLRMVLIEMLKRRQSQKRDKIIREITNPF